MVKHSFPVRLLGEDKEVDKRRFFTAAGCIDCFTIRESLFSSDREHRTPNVHIALDAAGRLLTRAPREHGSRRSAKQCASEFPKSDHGKIALGAVVENTCM